MSIRKASLLIISITILACCQNAKNASSVSLNMNDLASQKLGDGYKCELNSDQLKNLCSVQSKNKSGGYGVRFVVFETSTGNLIWEDNIDKGTVAWYDENRLALFYTPGTMQQGQTNDDYTYILDLSTKEKVHKSKLTD